MKTYDNYEISPCRRFEEPGEPGRFYFEVCEPHEADVWTLYGHCPEGGVEAIGDFATREHAEQTFQRITGIPFGSHDEIAARLRVMHAGPKLLAGLRCALADLEGIMPEFEPSGDKTHPAWTTIEELKAAIAQAEGRAA